MAARYFSAAIVIAMLPAPIQIGYLFSYILCGSGSLSKLQSFDPDQAACHADMGSPVEVTNRLHCAG